MGIFGAIKRVKTTKNDVKVAKLELEKEKLKSENRRIDQNDEAARLLGVHAKENADLYIEPVEKLLKETTEIVNAINEMNERGVRFKEKTKLSEYEEEATQNLEYLYLAKEYLCLIDKVSSGVTMTPNQATFIIKFSPFFDGRHVLEEDSWDEDNFFGGIKEELRNLKEEFFVSNKKVKEFSFDDLLDTYCEQIEDLKIPDFTQIFKRFRGTVRENKKPEFATDQTSGDTIICSKCSFVAPAGSKFCPSCGAQMQCQRFCTNCGEKLLAGAKFCTKCGNKVE